MGLLDLHAAGIDASVRRQLNNPGPAPEAPGFALGSFFGALPAGIGSGGLEAAASAADLITKETRAGNVLRRKANEWAPAETAHTADKVLHGLTRFGSKAAASVATLGPVAGAAVLALEEGNTTAQNLRMQGVDDATAAKVGAVTGVVSGVGAVLPVAGSTLARTAGLVALGGPAAYVGQEAASRDILSRAGYAEEAAKHDPTDPLGLALSVIVPGAFGAFHARNLRRIERVQTLQNEQQARAAAQLSPTEQAQSDAYERSPGNLRELEQAIAKEKRPEVKAELEAELAKQRDLAARLGQEPRPTDAATLAAADPVVVDAARVRLDADTLARALPDAPQARAEAVRAADAVAAGDQVEVLPLVSEPPPALRLAREVEDGAVYQIVDTAGEPVGSISTRTRTTAQADGDGFQQVTQIYNSGIDVPEAMGQGLGIRAYTQLVDEALADGRQVWSDTSVSPDAQRLYDGLERRGYTVERNPSRPPELESDGTLTTRGSYVYRVTKGSDAPARAAAQPEVAAGATREPASAIHPPSEAPSQASPTAEPARPVPIAEGQGETPAVDTATLQRLAAENADMPVRLPGSDKDTTLARALAAAKEEAAEEAKEADLFKAALECALGYGV